MVVLNLPQPLYRTNAQYQVLKNKQFLSYLTGVERFFGKDDKILDNNANVSNKPEKPREKRKKTKKTSYNKK